MGAVKTTLTFEQFERLPDEPGKHELLKGELVELPPAEYSHNERSQEVFLRVYSAVQAAHASGEAAQLGKPFHEMGYKLANHSYVQPDVSVTHADQLVKKYLGGAPAIAIEVVSPSNSATDL